MRYEVRNLRELVEFVDEMTSGDRLSFHTDQGVAIRVNQDDIWLHQGEPDWWVPSSKYLEPPYVTTRPDGYSVEAWDAWVNQHGWRLDE